MGSHATVAGDPPAYDFDIVRKFSIMTIVWGIFGMGVGVFIAAELVDLQQLLHDYP